MTVDEIVQKAREALALGITELHIVGGLHPSLPFSYYVDMLKALRALDTEVGSPACDSPELVGSSRCDDRTAQRAVPASD